MTPQEWLKASAVSVFRNCAEDEGWGDATLLQGRSCQTAVRMRQKASGTFRTEEGAARFRRDPQIFVASAQARPIDVRRIATGHQGKPWQPLT